MGAWLPWLVVVVVVMVMVGRSQCKEAQQEVKVLEVPRKEDEGNLTLYQHPLDTARILVAFTVCVRIRPFVLDGRTSFLSITLGYTDYDFVFRTEFRVNRIRLVVANRWILFPLTTKFRILRWYHLCFIHDPTSREVVTVVDGRSEYRAALAPLKEPLRADTLHLGRGPYMNYEGEFSQVNIWSRVLAVEEILELVDCNKDLAGDYVSWKDIKLPGLATNTVHLTLLCQRHSDPVYFIFPSVMYATAQYLCNALGSSLPQPSSREDVAALHALIDDRGLNVYHRHPVWTPINDIEKEGIWQSTLDEDAAPVLLWADGEPNGLTYENCAYITTKGMHDVSCEDTSAMALCKLEDQPVFTLHGMDDVEMQTSFVADQSEVGELVFQGFDGSFILKVDGLWYWKGLDNNTLASVAYQPPYPMGRHKWMMTGSSQNLLLTNCPDGHFTCNDATCVPIEQHCDYKFDCRDMSDEINCENLVVPDGYQRSLPPQPSGDHLLIIIIFHVMSVSVCTEAMHLELSFDLTLSWTERRIKFYNLKESRPNWLTYKDLERLWTPLVLFSNAEGNQYTVVYHNTIGHVHRNCTPDVKDTIWTQEVKTFPGSCNPITLNRRYKMIFNCEFDLLLYPFDQQTCQVSLLFSTTIRDHVKFHYSHSIVKYTGLSKLREYMVGSVQLHLPSECKETCDICIEVPLTRLWGHAVLTMYTPSLILLILSYLTLWFSPTVFEVRIMASLTSLLVMATFFTQSSSSLPSTSYIKMVDLWLLTCILLVFLIVIFHTLIEHYLRLEKKMKEEPEESWAERKSGFSTLSDLRQPDKKHPHDPPPSADLIPVATTRGKVTLNFIVWIARVTLPIVFIIFVIVYFTFVLILNN